MNNKNTKQIMVKLKKKIKKIPFSKKISFLITTYAVVIDVHASIKLASNRRVRSFYRILFILRAMCCSIALVTAYLSNLALKYDLAITFNVFSVFSSSVYVIIGGNITVSLALMNLSKISESEKDNK
jgi:hypothetical protein